MKPPRLIVALFTLLLASTGILRAQGVPPIVSYQGVLTASETPYTGTGYFKFALVNAGGDTTYWSNDGTSWGGNEPTDAVALVVSNGLFAVMLGDNTIPNMLEDLSPYIFNGADYPHLRIWFSEDNITFTPLSPDQRVASSPYAMVAGGVPFGAIGESQIANNAITASKIENGAVTANKLAASSVTGDTIANSAITSNKIDWSTMPALGGGANLAGYAENGTFATAPVASGSDAIALGLEAIASGNQAVVGGGYQNTASGLFSAIGGGYANRASADATTVGGGHHNIASNGYATVAGGWNNIAGSWYSTVAGGASNRASGNFVTVGGGYLNTASGTNATVAGGVMNTASGGNATVGGGTNNTASGFVATVGGGWNNVASAYSSTVGGGINNSATGMRATVSGGSFNYAEGTSSTVSGGLQNYALHTGATVGGGQTNVASGVYATIAGGRGNVASQTNSTVGGGSTNVASGAYATVGGGQKNIADSNYSTIAGGFNNRALASLGAVGGGGNNHVLGLYGTIPGGYFCRATNRAFAAGSQAQALHPGSFVWADDTFAEFSSTRSNQFAVRAGGGVWIQTASSGLNPAACRIESTTGNGVGLHITQNSSDANFVSSNAGAGRHMRCYSGSPATEVFNIANSGDVWGKSFTSWSDRNRKEDFEPVDAREILERVAALPITTWSFKGEATPTRHIGPMAQDFYAAFGVGENETGIATVDADGVALAAIQGLYAEARSQRSEVSRLQAENDALRTRLEQIETLLEALLE